MNHTCTLWWRTQDLHEKGKTKLLCVHIIAGHQGAIKMFYSNWLRSHCGHENDSAFPAVRSSTSHCDLSGKPALPQLFTLIYWFIDWTVLITWILPDKLAAVVHILAATEVIQSEMAYSVENESNGLADLIQENRCVALVVWHVISQSHTHHGVLDAALAPFSSRCRNAGQDNWVLIVRTHK